MKNFIDQCRQGYTGPSRATVRIHLTKLFLKIHDRLKTYFKTVTKISLTCDLWKATNLSHYLTLTGHWFDKSFGYHSTVLAFRIILERHIEKNLRTIIDFELSNLGIEKSKIASITTDNGADIKKAARVGQYGNAISCLLHIFNLVVQNGLSLWSHKRFVDTF
jgi:hypothetical protein